MKDITKQQILESTHAMFAKITENMATKEDIKDLRKEMATKSDLLQTADRLERNLSAKIKSSHTVNVRHHLESRAMLGDLNRKFDGLREGKARATTRSSNNPG